MLTIIVRAHHVGLDCISLKLIHITVHSCTTIWEGIGVDLIVYDNMCEVRERSFYMNRGYTMENERQVYIKEMRLSPLPSSLFPFSGMLLWEGGFICVTFLKPRTP